MNVQVYRQTLTSKNKKGGSHERPFFTTLLTFTTTNYLIYEKNTTNLSLLRQA
jgi:hypothetical protein